MLWLAFTTDPEGKAVQHFSRLSTANDGLELFQQFWEREDEAAAVVAIIHGYSEHSGRYGHVAEFLLAQGYHVAGQDLRGHGRSKGQRVFIPSYEVAGQDVEQFIAQLHERYPGKKLFVFAHSMGGAICSYLASQDRLQADGLLLSGPGIKINYEVSPLLNTLSGVLSALTPRLPSVRLKDGLVTHDAAMQAASMADKLVFRGRMPIRTGHNLTSAIAYFEKHAHQLRIPLLIMHGTDDLLADPAGSQLLYDRAASEDKTLKFYEGFYHEVVNEVGREQVLEDMAAWLAARL